MTIERPPIPTEERKPVRLVRDFPRNQLLMDVVAVVQPAFNLSTDGKFATMQWTFQATRVGSSPTTTLAPDNP